MKVFGIAGWSGSGKTTLLTKLIPELTSRGVTVSTIKHAHHNFDIDKPGKDSYVHRQAGASEVLISSAKRWALMHENRDSQEAPLSELLNHMSPVDLVLIEGFKSEPHPKLEVYRAEIGKPLLQADDPNIRAVASIGLEDDLPVPCLSLDDISAIADFIMAENGLKEGLYERTA